MSSGNQITIRKSRKDWRKAWIYGTISLVFYHLFALSWYHFYLYFFIAGIISYLISIQPWAKANSEGLKIFFGAFFNRQNVFIEWEKIYDLKVDIVQKKSTMRSGGRDTIPSQVDIEQVALVIKLKEKVSMEFLNCFQGLKKSFFNNDDIELKNDNTELLLYTEPEFSFESVVKKMKKYFKLAESDSYPKSNKRWFLIKNSLDALLVFASVYMVVYFNFIVD
jgi:hypothetical protein